MAVRLIDVARAANVSRSTASNVFTNPERVRPQLRAQVEAAAKTLGYAGPDPKARLLRAGKVNAVGVVVPGQWGVADTLRSPVFVQFLQGVAKACDKAGASIVLLPDAWSEYRDRGLAHAEQGHTAQAVDDLETYLSHAQDETCDRCIEPLPQDRRFADPAWAHWPFNVYVQSFLATERAWDRATHGVPGEGDPHGRIMLVGEQPGDQEDLAVEPVAGADQLDHRGPPPRRGPRASCPPLIRSAASCGKSRSRFRAASGGDASRVTKLVLSPGFRGRTSVSSVQ